ncbi:MAG TPA: hypothetical protein VGM29_00705 [Polyangiaceae bacterium]|jgi:hypothetical protein
MRPLALVCSFFLLALSLACSDPAAGTGRGASGAIAGMTGGGTGGSAGAAGSAGMGGSSGDMGGASGSGAGAAGAPPVGPFSTGLPGDTPLSGLTSDQLTTVCSALSSYLAKVNSSDGACRTQAFMAAILAARATAGSTDMLLEQVCQQAYDDCAVPTTPTLSMCNTPMADCTATIMDLEACYSAISTEVAGASAPACGALPGAGMLGNQSVAPLAEPAQCATLATNCPAAVPAN